MGMRWWEWLGFGIFILGLWALIYSAHQQRVILFGVLGAIFFRATFIVAGTALISHLHWVSYLFGAFIILTGLRMAKGVDDEILLDRNRLLRFIRAVLPATSGYRSERRFRGRHPETHGWPARSMGDRQQPTIAVA